MKFQLQKEEEKKEPTITLWLEEMGKQVYLKGIDSTGKSKTLLEFRDGKFHRIISANLDGVQTDEVGKFLEEGILK